MGEFWKRIEAHDGFQDFFHDPELATALFNDIPAAREWNWVGESNTREHADYPPMLYLLTDLAWYRRPYCPIHYDPASIILNTDPESFERILRMTPPDNADSAYWHVDYEKSGLCSDRRRQRFFDADHRRQRFAELIKQVECQYNGDTRSMQYDYVSAAAVVLILGEQVEIFTCPTNWAELVEDANQQLRPANQTMHNDLRRGLLALVIDYGFNTVRDTLEVVTARSHKLSDYPTDLQREVTERVALLGADVVRKMLEGVIADISK